MVVIYITRDSLQAERSGDRVPVGGEIFRTRPDRPCTMGTGSFLGAQKRPGRGVAQPLPSSAEIKEKAQLFVCYHSGRSWPVLKVSLLL